MRALSCLLCDGRWPRTHLTVLQGTWLVACYSPTRQLSGYFLYLLGLREMEVI